MTEIVPTGPIEIHPAAHVLHYASTCFEGFKAYRCADGGVHVFRMDEHIERMRQSARRSAHGTRQRLLNLRRHRRLTAFVAGPIECKPHQRVAELIRVSGVEIDIVVTI